MPKYLPLPDGSYLELREGENALQALARAEETYPEVFGIGKRVEEAESGFIPATKAGIAGLKSDIAALLGRTGAIDIPTAEKYMREQEEYQRRVFKPTEKGWTEAPGTKIAELLGGSLPYMAAPVAAGAATLALPVTGPAAAAAGLGAAGLTSAAQFTGSNIQRQVAEGTRLAETELGAAAAAAVPQAALDLVSFRMMPGIRRIFMQAGKEVPEAAAKKIAEQQVTDIAKDYALATGKAMGTEGLTEAGQQVLERLQAGLDITNPQARDEYFESFIGGAVLGGVISPAGRFVERGVEKRRQEEEAEKKRIEEVRKKRAEEEAYRLTPEYRQELNAQLVQMQDELRDVKAVVQDKTLTDDLRNEAKTRQKELEKEITKIDNSLKVSVKESKPPEEETTLQAAIARSKAAAPRTIVDEFGNVIQEGQKFEVPFFDEQGKPVTYKDKEGNTKLRTFKASLRAQGLTEEAEATGYQQQAEETQTKLKQFQADIDRLRQTEDAEEAARVLAPQLIELRFSVDEEKRTAAAIQKAKKQNDNETVEKLQSVQQLMKLARMGPIELQAMLRKNAMTPGFLDNLQNKLNDYQTSLQPTIQQYYETLVDLDAKQQEFIANKLKAAQQEQTQEGKITQIERLLDTVGLRMAGVKSSWEGAKVSQLSESLDLFNKQLETAKQSLDEARAIKVPAKPLPEDVAKFRQVLATSLPEDLLAPTKPQVEQAKAKAVAEAKTKIASLEQQRAAAINMLNKARGSRQYIEQLIDQGLVDANVAKILGIQGVKAQVRPVEANTLLDKIEARVADLEKARLGYASKELLTDEGKLTSQGNAFVNIEARLRELKRLQNIGSGTALERRTAAGEAVTPAEKAVTAELAKEPTGEIERAQQATQTMNDSIVKFMDAVEDLRKGEYEGGRKEKPVTAEEMAAAQAKLDRETASGGSLVDVTRTLLDSNTGQKRKVKEKASTIDIARKELEQLKKRASRTGGIGGKGVSPKTEMQLLRIAQAAGARYVDALINKINNTLTARGRPPLTENGEAQIRVGLEKDFTELTKRIRGMTRAEGLIDFLIPAQMRGTEIVKPAQTVQIDTRAQLERKFGSPGKAVAVILENIQEKTNNALALSAPEKRRVETGYTEKTYPRLGLRPTEIEAAETDVIQAIDNLVEEGRVTGELRQTLNDAADAIARGQTSQNFIVELKNAVSRIQRGMEPSLAEIRDELQRIARPEGKRKEVVPKGQKFVEKEVEVQADLFPAQKAAQKAVETKRAKATAVQPEYPGDLKQRALDAEDQLKRINQILDQVGREPTGLNLYKQAIEDYKNALNEIGKVRRDTFKNEEDLADLSALDDPTAAKEKEKLLEKRADLKKYLQTALRNALKANKDVKSLPVQNKELAVFLNLQQGLKQFQAEMESKQAERALNAASQIPYHGTLQEAVDRQYERVREYFEDLRQDFEEKELPDLVTEKMNAFVTKLEEINAKFLEPPFGTREARSLELQKQAVTKQYNEFVEALDKGREELLKFFQKQRASAIYNDKLYKQRVKKLKQLENNLTAEVKGTELENEVAKAAAQRRADLAVLDKKRQELLAAMQKEQRELEQRMLSGVGTTRRVVQQARQYGEREKPELTKQDIKDIKEAKTAINKLNKDIGLARKKGDAEQVASLTAQKKSLQEEIAQITSGASKTPTLISENVMVADQLAKLRGEVGLTVPQRLDRVLKQLRRRKDKVTEDEREALEFEKASLKQQIAEAEKANEIITVPAIKRTVTDFYSDDGVVALKADNRKRASKLSQLLDADEKSGFYNLSNSERRDYQKQYDTIRMFLTDKEPVELAAEYRNIQTQLKQQLTDLEKVTNVKEDLRLQKVALQTKIDDYETRIESMRELEKTIEKSMTSAVYESRLKRLVAPFEKREELTNKEPSVKKKAERASALEAEINGLEIELQELKQLGATGKNAEMSQEDIDKRIKKISSELANKYVEANELNTALEEFANDMHMALVVSGRETSFPVYRHKAGPRVKEGQLVTEPRATTTKVVVHEQMMDLFPAAPFKKPTVFRVGKTAETGINMADAETYIKNIISKLDARGKTGPDMTRRRLVQAMGASLVTPKMPMSLLNAAKTATLSADTFGETLFEAEKWLNKTLEATFPRELLTDNAFWNLKAEKVYNAVENLLGTETANLVDSNSYVDDLSMSPYLDEVFDKYKNDPTFLPKLTRAFDIAATGIFKELAKQLKLSEQQTQREEKALEKTNALTTTNSPIKFISFSSIKDLPADLKADIKAQGLDVYSDQIKGGVMPDGTVFVVLENHSSMVDLEKTLAHELVGHYTFEGLLGPDGMRGLLKRINDKFGDVFKLAKILGVETEASDAFAAGQAAGLSKENSQIKALQEVVAYTMEKRVDQSFLAKAKMWMQEMVGALRNALRKMGFNMQFSTSDLFYLMKEADRAFMEGKPVAYKSSTGVVSLSSEKAKWGRSVSGTTIETTQKIVAPRKTMFEKVFANFVGMNFRTQFIDAIDSLEKIKEIGLKAGLLDAVKAVDLTYFYRQYAQRMNYVSQAATNGVSFVTKVKRPDGGFEYMIDRDLDSLKNAASLKKVSQALSKVGYGNAKANGDFFTAYMACKRSKSVGKNKLNYTQNLTDNEIDAVIADGDSNAAIQQAREISNQYNQDLLTFANQSGAISDEQLKKLLSYKDYIPYYREAGDGVVSLWIDNEKIMKIGSTIEQPHLKELVGDNKPITDWFISSLQNTNMIMDMALRNLSTRNVAAVLHHLGIAKRISTKTAGATKNIIRAKIDGEEWAWSINTKDEGVDPVFENIPAELIVKGLDGIKTVLPGALRVMSVPADIFRKFITRNPVYAGRQIIRDSTAAYLATGSDALPVLGAIQELYGMSTGKSKVAAQLGARGGLGGQVITGTPEDMSKILLQVASGKPGWELAMAKLDAFAMAGDAATRVAAYNSFIRQGMSQREATLATLEIMNFTRRGISPSMLFLNSVIPFLSANIQGLDVTYRAFAGKMPGNKAMEVRRKLVMRGLIISAATIAYAIGMEDDEAYKNAKGVDRYSNWFVRVPGLDEPIRVPIPFELGYIFKALPEAMINLARKDQVGETVVNDMFKMLMRSVPGDLPLSIKPLIEVATNHSFFTDLPVVSKRLEGLDSKYQVNDKTPEVLRLLGYAGLSPAKAEHLVRGYTGAVGLAFLSMLNPIARPVSPTPMAPGATMRTSDLPLVGTAFQPNDATGMLEYAFDVVETARVANNTYKALAKEGKIKEAETFFKQNTEKIAMASSAGLFVQQMGDLATYERYIKASGTMTEKEKREKLDALRQQRIKLADSFYKVKKKIERQGVLAEVQP